MERAIRNIEQKSKGKNNAKSCYICVNVCGQNICKIDEFSMF